MLTAGEWIVDVTTRFLFNSSVRGTGVMTRSIPVPADPNITGFKLHAQARIRGTTPGMLNITLCNAEEIRIGCHHEEDE